MGRLPVLNTAEVVASGLNTCLDFMHLQIRTRPTEIEPGVKPEIDIGIHLMFGLLMRIQHLAWLLKTQVAPATNDENTADTLEDKVCPISIGFLHRLRQRERRIDRA